MPGVYFVYASSLKLSGTILAFEHDSSLAAVRHVILYAGRSDTDLRASIAIHLTPDTRRSQFRLQTGLILAPNLGLVAAEGASEDTFYFEPASEQRLTGWLAANTGVAWARR
jgi:hypothetical protein